MIITLNAELEQTRRRYQDDTPYNWSTRSPSPHDPSARIAELRKGLVEELALSADDLSKTQLQFTSLPLQAEAFHKNYLEYVEGAYARHYGVVVAPHTLWYVILAEIATAIKAAPETYRHLFSKSPEKISIEVQKGSCRNIDGFLDGVKQHIPTAISNFMPSFSTATQPSIDASQIMFLDAVSPYYSYFVLSCGIPRIRLDGTRQDWKLFESSLRVLSGMMGTSLQPYLNRVADHVEGIVSMFDTRTTDEERVEFWKGFYTNERCGSGGETLVKGWITELYREQPRLAKSCNFPPQIGKVEYTDLDTNLKYTIRAGLFYSTYEEGFLVPEFSSIEECVGVTETVGAAQMAASA